MECNKYLAVYFKNSYSKRVGTRAEKMEDNTKPEEKVKRLNKYIPDYSIDEFYSDSFSDTPLAKLSKRAFIVKGNDLFDWDEYKK